VRVFNRIVMILVLAGLFVAGVFTVVYGLDLLGYSLSSLSAPVEGAAGGVQSFIGAIEGGSPPSNVVAALVAVALLGVLLLVFEMKPRTPRRVRLGDGTYATRRAVQSEADEAAKSVGGVLGASSKAKPRRRSGARLKVNADVRRGEDAESVRSELESAVRRRLEGAGVPVTGLKTNLSESDPREAGGSRVR
jgi:hypothetical protein